jgi:LysR family glycine cleavage system transcriptional activator
MQGPHLPLRPLAVFEAAARLGSFREASDELGLTPSAVSHQVRLLEAGYGVRLFDRIGRGVVLSQEGQRLYDQVHEGFEKLREAVTSLKGRGRYGRAYEVVRVATPPSLASKWLLPRLSEFISGHPTIDIRVNAQPERGFDLANVDLAIVYGGAAKWSSRAVPLLEDAVQPLCAPSLLAGQTIGHARDLIRHTLIRTRGNAISWEDWLERNGIESARLKTIQLDPSHVAIEAAVRGLGIVLESDILTEDEIGSGELVAPLPDLAISAMSYWLMTPAPSAKRDSVETVRAWLIERAGSRRAGSKAR